MNEEGPRERLVLLVEDEPGISKMMTLLLEEEGYRVSAAANGREGLERLARERPDLIITDYMMPEMDGAELIRAVKAQSELREIPILLMSAALPERLPERSLVDRAMHKGATLDAILDAIASLLTATGGDSA